MLPDVRVLGRLGGGANGTVFSARDEQLDRTVALKVWHTRVPAKRLMRARGEVRKLAAVAHPLVVAIHRFGELGGVPYALMELVPGRTLHAWLAVAHQPFVDRLAAWRLYALAMAYIQECGVLHGDGHTKNVVMVDAPSSAYARLHEVAGTTQPIGLKVLDPGTSVLWGNPGDFRARDAKVLAETTDRIFPEVSVDALLSIDALESPLVLKALDSLVEYAALRRRLKQPRDDYEWRHVLLSLAVCLVEVPLFRLAAVLDDLDAHVPSSPHRLWLRHSILSSIDVSLSASPASSRPDDPRLAALQQEYERWRRAYLREAGASGA